MPRTLNGTRSLWNGWQACLAGICLCGAQALGAPSASSQPTPAGFAAGMAMRRAPSSVPSSQPVGGDFQSYYQMRLAALKPHDVDGLLTLALLCSKNDRPDLAADLSRQILETWPAHTRARALLRASNLRLAAASRPASTSRPVTTQPSLPLPGVLSREAINRIRLAEFHVDDMTDRPRVSITKRVIQEFLEEAAKNQAMSDLDRRLFREGANDDKLRWMIKVTGERYLDRVEMTSEPRSLAVFRQRVWPLVSRGCAAPSCHGGERAGSLRFVLPISYGPAMSTNFYIVSRFEAVDGRLVDREHAESSLLLQFGLPGDQGVLKHPVAISPVYTGPNDPKYQAVLDWIRQLRSPCPDYRITDRMWQGMPGRAGAPKGEPVADEVRR
jgi:hypothetical protein